MAQTSLFLYSSVLSNWSAVDNFVQFISNLNPTDSSV